MAKDKGVPAVGYIRMSTDMQEDSPARQRGEIERMAEREGYRILRWYEDHGLTGTESANRPQFQLLLQHAANREFQAVLLYEHSRFSREDVFDAMAHWKVLRDSGVKLVSCQRGELRFDDLAGLITAIVGQHEARSESVRIAQRSLSGRKRSAEAGIHCTRAPFGYEIEMFDESGKLVRRVRHGERFRKPPTWKRRLVPSSDPQLVDAVRFMFDAVTQGISQRQIAVEVNRRGLRSGSGHTFRSADVKRILTNPVYCGTLRFGHQPTGKFARCEEGTILVPNAHPAIIDPADFERVQSLVTRSYKSRGRAEPGRHLLSNLVFCGHCGRKMRGSLYAPNKYRKEGYRVYTCQWSPDGYPQCPNPFSVDGEFLEQMVLRFISQHVLCDENREQLTKAAETLLQRQRAPRIEEQQLADLRQRIERGQQNLALAEADSDFRAIAKLLQQWREREAELAERLEFLNRSEPAQSPEAFALIGDLAVLRENLYRINRVMLMAAVQQTISRVTMECRVVKDARYRIRDVEGLIEFRPGACALSSIPFGDADLFPERSVNRAVEYIALAGRPVKVGEIAEALELSYPATYLCANRAALLGRLEIQKHGKNDVRFALKSDTAG